MLPNDMAMTNHSDKPVQLGAEETTIKGMKLKYPERLIFTFIHKHI